MHVLCKSSARFVSLLDQTSDHAARGLVLVQSLAKLLANSLQVLFERERLEHHAVPLVLQRDEQTRNAGRWRGFGLYKGLG